LEAKERGRKENCLGAFCGERKNSKKDRQENLPTKRKDFCEPWERPAKPIKAEAALGGTYRQGKERSEGNQGRPFSKHIKSRPKEAGVDVFRSTEV